MSLPQIRKANPVTVYGGRDVEVRVKGCVSSVNSSTSTLTNGSTFTGSWEDVSDFPNAVFAVKTDQVGDLYVDFLPDGILVSS